MMDQIEQGVQEQDVYVSEEERKRREHLQAVQRYVYGLRKLADFYEETPELPLPDYYQSELHVWSHTISHTPKELAQLLGSFKKEYQEQRIYFLKDFGGVTLRFEISREKVCRKVSKGKQLVERQVIEGTPTKIIEAHEEEVFEWVCDDPVLGGEGATEAEVEASKVDEGEELDSLARAADMAKDIEGEEVEG